MICALLFIVECLDEGLIAREIFSINKRRNGSWFGQRKRVLLRLTQLMYQLEDQWLTGDFPGMRTWEARFHLHKIRTLLCGGLEWEKAKGLI